MLDRRIREELAGVLALGRFAEKMVFTLGRVARGEHLSPEDEAVMHSARALFDLMTKQDVVVVGAPPRQMLSDDSYLDALHVVQLQAGGTDVEASAQQYVELIDKALARALSTDEHASVEALRDLFEEVGETTLARANEISRTPQEPSWRLMRPATSRF